MIVLIADPFEAGGIAALSAASCTVVHRPTLKGKNAAAVAELAFGLMLALDPA